jgi:hypothetical protein
MPAQTTRQQIQKHLRDFNFRAVFIDVLGWDNLREHPLDIPIDGTTYTLHPLVEKRGIKVYTCTLAGQPALPPGSILRKIDSEVTRHAYEHFIIYSDTAKTQQIWQWVKRDGGRSRSRLHRYHSGQSGEALAQRLEALAISLEEEERLTMPDISGRVAKAFDVERITRKFYDRFKLEHSDFLKFIEGITAQADREWYASLMLNRLMFIYFIQRKGFLDTKTPHALDGDTNYLSNRLKRVREQCGEGQFYTFYRHFLQALFHDGLSKRDKTPEIVALLGNVPYLNGGLFDIHILERDYPDIDIPDKAFEKLFKFFNEFDWHLDTRPLRNDREINPDVLGYIFEKYINQKQMGAYYTKEDITEYISKNTIIPFLFDAAEQKCLVAFQPNGPVWPLLRENPDAYIYDAVKKGCDLPLPPEIEAGVHDVAQRGEWNKPAPEEYALPTEIWREVVARRQRYHDVRTKLADGQITSINDLITYNLDIQRFAEDAITYCEGTNLLRAFYECLETVSILDPTCGSGAFLFAALNILEKLYEACLERMQNMVEERDALDSALPPAKRRSYPDINYFRDVLKRVKDHPSRAYFIYKSIIVNNLYGVDIMEEATEICKLRLFLKLVSQVETFDHIEPLPDIDFNIRAGNTLVGFASQEETKKAIEGKTTGKGTKQDETAFQRQILFDDTMQRIEEKAKEVERAFEHFRKLQTEIQIDPIDMSALKQQVREKLHTLRAELDGYLASQYGIDRNNIPKKEVYDEKFAQWQQSHQPFHWWIEFYGIMKKGGFDVIIGNPPYVEYKNVRHLYTVRGFTTESCDDLYAFVMERSKVLLGSRGNLGMIVPVSIVSTDGFAPLRDYLRSSNTVAWATSFAERPSKLFTGVEKRLTIWLSTRRPDTKRLFLSKYRRWFSEERESQTREKDALFPQLGYVAATVRSYLIDGVIPKIASATELNILAHLSANRPLSTFFQKRSAYVVYYTRKLRYFVQFYDFVPLIRDATGQILGPSELKELYLEDQVKRDTVIALLNSNLFFWFFTAFSDVRNVNRREIEHFRCSLDMIESSLAKDLISLKHQLMDDFQAHAKLLTNNYGKFGILTIQTFQPRLSKPIIDEIDRVLARHYGFTDEELDFIINYDIKYRMGHDNADDEEGE